MAIPPALLADNTKHVESPKNGSSWIAGFQSDEAPYSYTTDSGEQYDVVIVTYKFGKKVETGTISFCNGDKYEGDWSMGCKNGKGIYRCANGVVYDGRWKDDMRHGYGTCTYANGDIYKGKWAKNQKHGDGCYTFANGNEYTGDWRSDRACGKGVCQYANGDKYEGDWKDDRAHGNGIYIYKTSERYDGAWIKGKKYGLGTFKFQCGDMYTGEFKEDDVWGKGKKVYADGGTYEGDWVKGLRHGKGKLIEKSGKAVHDGDWRNDEPYSRQKQREAKDKKDAEDMAIKMRQEMENKAKEQLERDKRDQKLRDEIEAKERAAAAERQVRELELAAEMEQERLRRAAAEAQEELIRAATHAEHEAALWLRAQEEAARRVEHEKQQASEQASANLAYQQALAKVEEDAVVSVAHGLLDTVFLEEIHSICLEAWGEADAGAASLAAASLAPSLAHEEEEEEEEAASALARAQPPHSPAALPPPPPSNQDKCGASSASKSDDDALSGDETARRVPPQTVGPMCQPPAWGLRPCSPITRPVTPLVREVRDKAVATVATARSSAGGLAPLSNDEPQWILGVGGAARRPSLHVLDSCERLMSARRPLSARRPSSPRASLEVLTSDEPDEEAVARYFGEGAQQGLKSCERNKNKSSQRRPQSPGGSRSSLPPPDLEKTAKVDFQRQLGSLLGEALKGNGHGRLQVIAPSGSLHSTAPSGSLQVIAPSGAALDSRPPPACIHSRGLQAPSQPTPATARPKSALKATVNATIVKVIDVPPNRDLDTGVGWSHGDGEAAQSTAAAAACLISKVELGDAHSIAHGCLKEEEAFALAAELNGRV